MHKIKTLIIGAGRMGQRHIDIAHKANLSIEGVFDISSSALQQVHQKYNVPYEKLFTSIEDALNHKYDAAVIATTTPFHADYALKCIDNNIKYILCEKPLSSSVAAAQALVDIAHEKNISLAVNHQGRFGKAHQFIKSVKDMGALHIVNFTSGNCGISMIGSHIIDGFYDMVKPHSMTVQAWLDKESVPSPRGAQYADISGSFRVETDNNKVLNVQSINKMGHGAILVYGFTYGQIIYDRLSENITVIKRKPDYKDEPTTRYGLESLNETTQDVKHDIISEAVALWQELLSEKGKYPNAIDGLNVVKTLAGMYESDENHNQPINIDNISSHFKNKVYPWA